MKNMFECLKFSFYILAHPFDGFWILKSEKRGNVKSATVLLALFFLTLALRIYSVGYLISGTSENGFSVWVLLLLIVFLFILYSVSNWALTTLFDGKGKFSEVYTALCYASVPITLFNIPLAVISRVITLEETSFYTFFSIASVIWMIFLLLAANLSTHDYTMTKSIITFICTVIAMIIIIVLLVLFANLVQQVYLFILSVIKEAAFRI